jgi:hypothetical protein
MSPGSGRSPVRGEARVVATFIDGVAVHERPDLDG